MLKLTPKQEKACHKYIELGDKSAAYRSAYNCMSMKPESINRKAHELFEKVNIRSRVEELQKEIAWRNELTIDSIIQELKRIILFNPKDLFNEEGNLKKISDLPYEVSAAISSADVSEVYQGSTLKRSNKIKFYNKLDALEKLAKHLGF
ncbi:terminase small subunit [Ancylomarina euxinus]|uniref:Terminase small subunit n=1 Tax=Ancylomarina euxinus TaxID=2283627 RepID=A0A425Y8T1_9BACT|nr:terminase small subunit [Ancylomarina euxinus]MCZ4693386.1 terminase small subunit [Ancylomarina euxinus]MUP13614.1 hypothetical protein [Ancylomarina euxinus]RRG24742.1 terminase small subunit [Ancylomarina euxinus]